MQWLTKVSHYVGTRRPPVIAAVVFALSALFAMLVIWQVEKAHVERARAVAFEQADSHAHAIRLHVDEALSAAYALGALVQLGKGNLDDFENTAKQLLSFYPGASSLQLAPDGVIARIVPLAGNEKAIGHNLLTDPARDKEAFLARDTGKLTLAGPFALLQGGQGAAGRLPIYLDDGSGKPRFWGFVVVLLRFPETLGTARLAQLATRGYDFELWRTHPDTNRKQVIAASSQRLLAQPVERTLDVPNATWTLSVAPVRGWIDYSMLAYQALLGLLVSVLLSYYVYYRMRG